MQSLLKVNWKSIKAWAAYEFAPAYKLLAPHFAKAAEWLAVQKKRRFDPVLVPSRFPEQQTVLGKPVNWDNARDGVCGGLPVFRNGHTFISCWRGSLWARILFLWTGKLWLGVVSEGQPPVWIDTREKMFHKLPE